jgi:hypothetical protein
VSPRLTWAVPASLLAINLIKPFGGVHRDNSNQSFRNKGPRSFDAVAGSCSQPEASPAPTTFTLTEMVKNMGGVAIAVVIVLLIMSVYSIAIMVERYLTYSAAKKQSREFAPRVAQALKNDRIEEAINISDKHRKSHLAMVVSSGLQEFRAHEASSIFRATRSKRRSARCSERSRSRPPSSNAACQVWRPSVQPLRSWVCSERCSESSTRSAA